MDHISDPIKRTIQILIIVMKSCRSTITMLFLIYFGVCLLNETLIYYMGMIPFLYGSPIANRNYQKVLKITFLSFGVIFIMAICSALKELLIMCIKARARKNLVKYLQKIYLKKLYFYKLNFLVAKFNYDQIMSQDTLYISQHLVDAVTHLFSPLITIFFYTYQCCIYIGWLNTVYMFIYFFVLALISKIAARPLTLAQWHWHQEEGTFRNKYSELREYAEEIALQDGTEAEKCTLNCL